MVFVASAMRSPMAVTMKVVRATIEIPVPVVKVVAPGKSESEWDVISVIVVVVCFLFTGIGAVEVSRDSMKNGPAGQI